MYCKFHFLAFDSFGSPSISFALKYPVVPNLNFGEGLHCKWRSGSDWRQEKQNDFRERKKKGGGEVGCEEKSLWRGVKLHLQTSRGSTLRLNVSPNLKSQLNRVDLWFLTRVGWSGQLFFARFRYTDLKEFKEQKGGGVCLRFWLVSRLLLSISENEKK